MASSNPSVLLEKEGFLVVSKPAFWTCELPQEQKTPSAGSGGARSLAGWLSANARKYGIALDLFRVDANPALSGDVGFGPLCHRLDRETSGPMLVGKSKQARHAIREEFHRLRVAKNYLCLVHGKLDQPSDRPGSLKFPIRTVRSEKSTWSEVANTKDAEPAQTDYQVLAYFRKTAQQVRKEEANAKRTKPVDAGCPAQGAPEDLRADDNVAEGEKTKAAIKTTARSAATRSSTSSSREQVHQAEQQLSWFSLVACRIHSGRTHQIRVHMRHIGHPLVQDDKYGSTSTSDSRQLFCSRLFLHSYLLGFHFSAGAPAEGVGTKRNKNDIDKKPYYEVLLPLPGDLKKCLQSLQCEEVVCEKIDSFEGIRPVHWREEVVSGVIPHFNLRTKVLALFSGTTTRKPLSEIERELRDEIALAFHHDYSSTSTCTCTYSRDASAEGSTSTSSGELEKKSRLKELFAVAWADEFEVHEVEEAGTVMVSRCQRSTELEDLRQRKRDAIEREDYVLAATLKAMEQSLLSSGDNGGLAGTLAAQKQSKTTTKTATASTSSRTVLGDIRKKASTVPDRADREEFPALGGGVSAKMNKTTVHKNSTATSSSAKAGGTSAKAGGGWAAIPVTEAVPIEAASSASSKPRFPPRAGGAGAAVEAADSSGRRETKSHSHSGEQKNPSPGPAAAPKLSDSPPRKPTSTTAPPAEQPRPPERVVHVRQIGKDGKRPIMQYPLAAAERAVSVGSRLPAGVGAQPQTSVVDYYPRLIVDRMREKGAWTMSVAELAELVPEFAEKMQQPKPLELRSLLQMFLAAHPQKFALSGSGASALVTRRC